MTKIYARLALSILAERRGREGRLMSMEAMSAAIEHEIRQPLGAIMANANAGQRWLGRSPPEIGEVREALDCIASDAQRSTEVIRSFRAMFGRRDQPETQVDANELIWETVALMQNELDATRVAVSLDLTAGLPRVHAYRGQLQQVIMNLVHNAADSMRGITDREAVLRFTSRLSDSNGVELIVSDTGTGVDPKNAERIFDPFFTTKPNGMGMGLAICRSIIESHGGTLSLSHALPHGSAFRLSLPSAGTPATAH
jgi:signal transduction histidine kinase